MISPSASSKHRAPHCAAPPPGPRLLGLLLLITPLALAQTQPSTLLARVSEEAEVLQQNAPKILTTEHLEQRTILPPTRFKPRVGAAYLESLKPMLRVREVTSEYSFGALQDGPSSNLLEFRQVISVDGREVQSRESASRALSAAILSTDDRGRKRMLEAFASNAIGDIATDYALIVLAFTHRGQEELTIHPRDAQMIGTDDAVTFDWQQNTAATGALEFHGKESARRALQGTLWVRERDGLPLRVSAWMEHLDEAKHLIRDEAVVDYSQSVHGFLTPASVAHKHYVDGHVTTENLYTYEPFKLFSSSSQIKFGDPAPVKK